MAVTIADKSGDFFIEPLHLGQVFDSDINDYFGLDCIKRFHDNARTSENGFCPLFWKNKQTEVAKGILTLVYFREIYKIGPWIHFGSVGFLVEVNQLPQCGQFKVWDSAFTVVHIF